MQHKILIVEDEEIIRLGLQDNFELENYIVETAADGEEAIAKADSFMPLSRMNIGIISKTIREGSLTRTFPK